MFNATLYVVDDNGYESVLRSEITAKDIREATKKSVEFVKQNHNKLEQIPNFKEFTEFKTSGDEITLMDKYNRIDEVGYFHYELEVLEIKN